MTEIEREVAEARIRRVAEALGGIRERLVFIGGAVLPLLVDVEARFSTPRVTKDVDAIAGSASYTDRNRFETALRNAGFRNDMSGPLGRWRTPYGETFDLSFAGQHLGATGANVDALAISMAVAFPDDPTIRHLSAVGFFLMKSAAFRDRGTADPFGSKDLADLAVLLVGRVGFADEATRLPAETQSEVRVAANLVLRASDPESALRSHFQDRRPVPPDTPAALALDVMAILRRLADNA